MNTSHVPADAGDAQRFLRALALIDEANRGDPRVIEIGGISKPYELGYAERLTHWVLQRDPRASERLMLAARAQHLKRWALPRSEFPDGRRGYLHWREKLKAFHAAEVEPLLVKAGYPPDTIQSVQGLIRKANFPRDPDTQIIEDGLCLVFIELQLEPFLEKHPQDKVIDIIQKTWAKMSPAGQTLALSTSWPGPITSLLARALETA